MKKEEQKLNSFHNDLYGKCLGHHGSAESVHNTPENADHADRTNHADTLKACLAYFREDDVWVKIFRGFREKYRSYGRFAGKVVVKNLKAQDIEVLEGFFCKSFHGRKSATISAEKFTQALENSRYAEVTPEEILEAYFGEPLLGKAEELRRLEDKVREIEAEYITEFAGTSAEPYLVDFEDIIKTPSPSNTREWKRQLWLCAEIHNALPYHFDEKMYLAVFAAGVCGNPHAFDAGTSDGALLYKVVEHDLKIRNLEVSASGLFPAYKRQKSYLLAGIMIDDISNYALLYNVRGLKADGERHRGIEGFFEEKSIMQLPLNVLADLSSMECVDNEIYIVENPSVFAMLCGQIKDRSCMCMNGQPRLAGLMVLDLLAKSRAKVYYSGDLDPEGLLIAQKLAQYYEEKFRTPGDDAAGDEEEFSFWHMKAEDYEICRSEELLSDRRLKILENIGDERLIPAAGAIRKFGKAGYQENIAWIK